MKIIYLLIIMAVLLGCTSSTEEIYSNEDNKSKVSAKMPTANELIELKKDAFKGGGVEAVQLSMWYMKYPEKDDTFEYWTKIAAENGSEVGQYNLAIIYMKNSDNNYKYQRANFWLEESAKQGYLPAIEKIAEIKEK